jgi:hypothetical protein
MLQKLFLIFLLFVTSTAMGQYKICKQYYASSQEDAKKELSSISYYDERQNIIRKVLISGTIGYDTTDYVYENNLLVKEVRYSPIEPISSPVDSVLNYIRKHPEALGHSLHHIVKQNLSDTELTRYHYNNFGLLTRKENASYENNSPMAGNNFSITGTDGAPGTTPRSWQRHRTTNYLYNDKRKLVEASGDLFDKSFGYDSEYGESARKYFYNSKNEIALDSIVSYTGATFDGSVSNYAYSQNGYEVSVTDYADGKDFFGNTTKYGAEKPDHYILVFKFNDQGKILEEAHYDKRSPQAKIEDPGTILNKKNLYEYDSSGRLVKKSVFYYDTATPRMMYYYSYE